ncbi:hypothetical protein N7463_006776 [Penicillium fimorum]|uniref:Uncharacterized protein n=1 Tax=Penicillium fimorum TaxID=1882269 RepID=A0A9X0C6H3_9EURO|nr:hypothetical protein N7463_006776 [Penicillium fimorum]
MKFVRSYTIGAPQMPTQPIIKSYIKWRDRKSCTSSTPALIQTTSKLYDKPEEKRFPEKKFRH